MCLRAWDGKIPTVPIALFQSAKIRPVFELFETEKAIESAPENKQAEKKHEGFQLVNEPL